MKDDDGDAAADLLAERRHKREVEQHHYNYVKERHQVEGPIEVDGRIHYFISYWDEELGKLGTQEREISGPGLTLESPGFKNVFDMEVENAIWWLTRLRMRALSQR